jgi:hypothetical protein
MPGFLLRRSPFFVTILHSIGEEVVMWMISVFVVICLLAQAYTVYDGRAHWSSVVYLGAFAIVGLFLGLYLGRRRVIDKLIDRLGERKDIAARHKEALAWMAEHKPTKLELNAAIEKLINTGGKDEESARLIATLAYSLQDQPRIRRERAERNKPGILTGFTQEAGDVSVESAPTSYNYSANTQKERVGQYKIFRTGLTVIIEGFWMSELNTGLVVNVSKPWHVLILSLNHLDLLAFGMGTGSIVSDKTTGGKRIIVVQKKVIWLSGPKEGQEGNFSKQTWIM